MSALDRFGMIVSGACLVHCLALPLLAALLPFLSVTLPGDEWTHTVLLGAALPITGLALLRGWRRHRAPGPALGGVLGLGIIAAALFAPDHATEAALTVVGGLIVIRAHIGNWRALHA